MIPEPVDLEVSYAEALGPREEAYQRLLDTLAAFASAAWQSVQRGRPAEYRRVPQVMQSPARYRRCRSSLLTVIRGWAPRRRWVPLWRSVTIPCRGG